MEVSTQLVSVNAAFGHLAQRQEHHVQRFFILRRRIRSAAGQHEWLRKPFWRSAEPPRRESACGESIKRGIGAFLSSLPLPLIQGPRYLLQLPITFAPDSLRAHGRPSTPAPDFAKSPPESAFRNDCPAENRCRRRTALVLRRLTHRHRHPPLPVDACNEACGYRESSIRPLLAGSTFTGTKY